MPYGVKVRVLSAAQELDFGKLMQDNISTELQNDKKSIIQVIIHSFFVIPFIISIFAVMVFLMIRILTSEPNTARDFLEDVKIGGATKRWQGAFELSKLLSSTKMVPKDDSFVNEMISTFEYYAKDRDERIRQYLALAMGATKDRRYVEILIDALKDSNQGVLQACAFALGNIGDPSANEALIELLENQDPQTRLHSVMALGKIGSSLSNGPLRRMLNDREPNVRWDAAIALAKQKDFISRTILLDLLDREYLNSFTNIDEKERVKVILVAIKVSHFVGNEQLKLKLEELKDSDPNLKIREAARFELKNFL